MKIYMNNLLEYICKEQYEKVIFENFSEIISERTINEAFQSSLLLALAKKINDVEKENRQKYKEEVERYKKEGYSCKPSNTAKSFSSIFAPIIQKNKWGSTMKVAQGLKWSEIKDSDFVKYTDANDKNFKKILKSVYAHKTQADIIVCEPGTQNIKYFIKGYGEENSPVKLYQFKANQNWQTRKGVYLKTVPYRSYQERPLNFNEAIDVINGFDIYLLVITDSMQKEYKSLFNAREENKKGVINYDKESLQKLLDAQQARYKAVVEKAKALKLQTNLEQFLDEIIAVNNEVSELFRKITINPANMDLRIDLGDLMRNVSYIYDYYYNSIKDTRNADKTDEAYPKANFGEYDRESAQKNINSAKELLDKVKKDIKNIKSQIK